MFTGDDLEVGGGESWRKLDRAMRHSSFICFRLKASGEQWRCCIHL